MKEKWAGKVAEWGQVTGDTCSRNGDGRGVTGRIRGVMTVGTGRGVCTDRTQAGDTDRRVWTLREGGEGGSGAESVGTRTG